MAGDGTLDRRGLNDLSKDGGGSSRVDVCSEFRWTPKRKGEGSGTRFGHLGSSGRTPRPEGRGDIGRKGPGSRRRGRESRLYVECL